MRRQPDRQVPAGQQIRCAVYVRKSTDEGLESEFNSLDAQRESGESCAASHRAEGWVVAPTRYDDGGYSGATLERPGIQRLLADVEAGRIDVIIVYKIDRLTRSLLDFSKLVEIFDRCHVPLVSVTERFDTSTPMGRLTLHMLLSFAQFEREVIAERIRDKVAATKRKGKYCGGPPVLGYDVDRERKCLVVNPEQADLVLHIFEEFARHRSTTTLAQQLTDEGHTTKTWTTKKGVTRVGGPWNKGHLYRLLNNPLYIGEVAHKGERYPGEHEPIVSRQLWDQAQAILRQQYRGRGAQIRAKTEALLRGIIRCATCGCAMGPTFTKRRGKVYRYYLCVSADKHGSGSCPVGNLSAGEIERTVVEQLRRVFRAPEVLAQTSREARAQATSEGEPFPEQEVFDALRSLDPIWEQLFPQEQERIVQLLVKRVDVYPDRAELQIRAEGLTSLVAELCESAGEEGAEHE